MIGLMNWKEYGRNGSLCNLRFYSDTCLARLKNTTRVPV